MRAVLCIIFRIKNYIGTQGEDLSTVECFKPKEVSKAVVLVLFLLCVACVCLFVFTTGRFMLSRIFLFVPMFFSQV